MTNPSTNIYGSLDIQFECNLNDGTTIELDTDILCIAEFLDESVGYNDLAITLTTKTVSSITYSVCSTLINGVVVNTASQQLANSYVYPKEHIRIFINDENMSIYIGGKWVYSYVLGFVNYINDPVGATLVVHGTTIALDNIRRVELHDYRDAVYVDYEATADSALQSVIQERPVQVFAEPDRSLSFTYHTIKDILVAHHVKEYSPTVTPNSNLSSDGLIYFTNVSINTSEETADEVGFITRLYRLSNLENGAVQATKMLQKLALERRYPMQIKSRFDPRVVIADEIQVDKYISGTSTRLVDTCIVEDVQIQLQDGTATMILSGRRLKDG